MIGQYSIFDVGGNQRPCDYDFQRYIGQRVEMANGVKGIITDIKPYYTDVLGDDGVLYAGSPTTCYPEEE